MYSFINNNTKHPFVQLIRISILFFGALFVSQFIATAILMPFYGQSLLKLAEILNKNLNDYPEYRPALLVLQAFTSFGAMVVMPLLLIKKSYKSSFSDLNTVDNKNIQLWIILTPILILILMPFIGWMADMNMALKLPDAFKEIEKVAWEKELAMKKMTDFLTYFKSWSGFGVGLVVIAIIPALGEELIFRGLIQNIIMNWKKNQHIAIWASAFIFSAIHFQFYGFFPRFVLGALFGYLYYWSGSLWISILAHFTNNGVTLLLIHLKNSGYLDIDLETTNSIPQFYIVASAVLGTGIIYILHQKKYLFDKIDSE